MVYVDVKIVLVVMLSSMIFLTFRDRTYGGMAGGLFSIDRELERELFRLVDSRRKLSESEESFAIEMFRISNLIFRKAISIDQL